MTPSFWISDGLTVLLVLASTVSLVLQRRSLHTVFSACTLLAAIGMLAFAALSWFSPVAWHAPQPIEIGIFPFTFSMDTLSCVFVAMLGVVTLATSLFSPAYLRHLENRINTGIYWSALCLFVLGMFLVLVSADAITFLVFWELMSLSSAALVASDHRQHRVQQAALLYLGATRIATAFLAVGFLWMYHLTHSWAFADWQFVGHEQHIAAFLIFIGFCIKAGVWPFHIWLPKAHPAAPTPVSALMSGVMIKVAIYGMLRLLVFGGLDSVVIACVALVLGVISAFWGVLYALLQHDLKELLAYSSVENIGLILMAIAVALYSKVAGVPLVAGIAIAAALFHAVNHGMFKSLLFLGAGSVDAQAHTRELGQLGGLAKRMPWTMACFVVGSAAICALPPLNGFASKWFIYQALFKQTWMVDSQIVHGVALACIGVLAMVGGLAVAAFTKAVGVCFLGNPRSHSAEHATEASTGIVASQVVLGICCVALGLGAPQALRLLAPIVPKESIAAFDVPLPVVAAALLTLYLIIYLSFLRTSKVRKFITWECGFGNLTPRTQVSGPSFAQPVARIFSPILRYQLSIKIRGRDRRHFPEQIIVQPRMVSWLEQRVYGPAIFVVSALANAVAKLQAGSIHLYLMYVCITLVLLLFVGTKL